MKALVAGVLTGLPLVISLAARAGAQAWIPPKGELTTAVAFQRVDAQGHFGDDGSRQPGYRSRASNVVVDVAYSLTDRVAVTLGVPFVNVKYNGPEAPFNLPENKVDDGKYHGSVTDIRLGVRGSVIETPFVVTPFFAASIPSHSYPTIGEAAPGSGFQVYRLGVHTARALDPLVPNAFVHGTYSYAIVRQNIGVPLNASNVELEAGYSLLSAIQLSLLWSRQWAHGGLTFAELAAAPPATVRNFDRNVRVNFQHVGIGASFPLTESLSLQSSYVDFVSGTAAHFGYGFSFGFAWTVQTYREKTPFDR